LRGFFITGFKKGKEKKDGKLRGGERGEGDSIQQKGKKSVFHQSKNNNTAYYSK